ncbi:MAG: EamA family transporter [Patescibacteria group bacterium]
MNGFIFAIGAAILWGLVYTIDQKILHNTSPMALLFVDSLLTALLVLPFLFFDHGSIKALLSSGRLNWTLIISSLLLAALANFLIFSGIKLIGASAASMIEITYPFFVVLFSILILRSQPNICFYLGGALVFIGSAIIIYFH